MNKRNRILLLAAILALAFLIRALPVDTSYFFWDEAIYLMHADYFRSGDAPYTEHEIRPQFVPFMLALLPQSEAAYRIAMAAANSLLVILAYLFGREANEKAGLIAAALAALLPFHIIASKWVMTDALAAMLTAGAAYSYWKGLREGKTAMMYAGGMLFWLGFLTKFTSLIFLGVYALMPFLARRKARANYLLSIIATATITIPYLLFNYTLFGNPVHAIKEAFFVVQQSQPAGIAFTIYSIADFFGILLSLLILSAAATMMKKEINKDSYTRFLMFWAATTIAYYIFILQRGVAKPPGIEWEAERFLLPAMMPVIALAAAYASRLSRRIVIAIVAVLLLSNIFYMERITTPAVDLENGLRNATKEMGSYIATELPKEEKIYCMGNCPVIAYYSQHRTEIAAYGNFRENSGSIPENAYLAVLTKIGEESFEMPVVTETMSGEWKETLYRVP